MSAEHVQPDPGFCRQVEEQLGGDISSCYHCNKCAGGCPVGFAMDLLPNRVVRMVQMGQKDQVLRSSTIWLCASCQTCSTRCPNEVDIARLMDALRETAVREGVPAAEANVPLFHAAFLAAVEKRGRVFEAEMLARYTVKARKTRGVLADAGLGWEMLKRAKLRLWPDRVRDTKQVRRIFRQSGA
ncbi:MAG: 4Fe-4S dicluster domain-containing protein [Candidatus Latescibacterota bacterium]